MWALLSSVDKTQRFDGVRAPRSWGARLTGMLVFAACLAFVAALPDLLKFLGSWKHAWKVLVPALLVCASLHAQTTKIAPDCPIVLASRSTTGTSSVYDNRPPSALTSPCTEFILTASATTANASFTVAVEGAQDNGAASCAGCSWSTIGSLTLSAEGTKTATKIYADYVRINLSAISGGTVSATVSAWRPNQSTTAGAGGGGVGCTITGFTPGSVLFIAAGPVCAQDNANFFWDDTNKALALGPNDVVQLTALDAAIFDNVADISIGNGTTTFGSRAIYSGGGSNGALYFVTSGGTFASPTNSTNGAGMGFIAGVYYRGGWQNAFGPLFDFIIDDVTTGADHVVTVPLYSLTLTPTQVVGSAQRASGQTADIYDYLDSDGVTVLAHLDASAKAFFPNLNDSGLTASTPVISDSSKTLASGSYHGNPSVFQMSDGTGASGNLASYNADGRVTDSNVPAALNATTASLNLGSVSDGTCVEANFTLTGAVTTNDLAGIDPTADGVQVTYKVASSNTIRVKECNFTGSAYNPGSLTYGAAVIR